jgi:hypothetical protein
MMNRRIHQISKESHMNPDEQTPENPATPRAGGNILTKGPSKRTEDTEAETKSNTATPGDDTGTRAGGNILTKGPSKKEEKDSQ